jgi:glutaredoxin 3
VALKDSIMAEPITLYVKTGCPYCAAKRGEFQQKGVKFTEINVTNRPEVIPELLRLTRGERLVPVIVQGQRVSIAPEGG